MSLGDVARNLARLDLAAVRASALASAAQTIADAVREALSHEPGADHRFPWHETGALEDSIEVAAEGDIAVIGSTSEVALDQEQGTRTMPPRPFLSPIAAEHGDVAVETIGAAIAKAIRNAV